MIQAKKRVYGEDSAQYECCKRDWFQYDPRYKCVGDRAHPSRYLVVIGFIIGSLVISVLSPPFPLPRVVVVVDITPIGVCILSQGNSNSSSWLWGHVAGIILLIDFL